MIGNTVSPSVCCVFDRKINGTIYLANPGSAFVLRRLGYYTKKL